MAIGTRLRDKVAVLSDTTRTILYRSEKGHICRTCQCIIKPFDLYTHRRSYVVCKTCQPFHVEEKRQQGQQGEKEIQRAEVASKRGRTLTGLPAPHFWSKQENSGSITWHHERGDPVTVIEAVQEKDNQKWLFLSITKGERTPTITDIRVALHLFVGENRECYIVFPKGAIENHVVKIVCCLDKVDGVLPTFE